MGSDWKRRFTWIDIGEIDKAFLKEPFPRRPPRGDLASLQQSIAGHGVIHPIVARVLQGRLQVVCGYRRWLAAQVAGIERIPVVVSRLSDAEARALFEEEERWSLGRAAAGRADREPGARRARPTGAAAEVGPGHAATARAAESHGTPRGEGVASARPAPPFERAALSYMEPLRAKADLGVEKLTAVFEEIGRVRHVPMERVEEISEFLRLLAPVRLGLDIRDVGVPAFGPHAAAAGSGPQRLATHSVRVALLAQNVAESCGWSVEGIRRLGSAALLHDAGMLFVPAEWFDSPYPLTKARKETIERHASVGEELILHSSPGWKEIADVARDHHERWDGTGYPNRKAGRRVSLAARLIGLLDTYTALISRRSYRAPYLIREALGMVLEAAKVRIFEPSLVKRFLDVLTSIPVGTCGTLPDGTELRVREVVVGREKSHRAHVTGPRRGPCHMVGEEVWFREGALAAQLTEALPARSPASAATAAGATAPPAPAVDRLAEPATVW